MTLDQIIASLNDAGHEQAELVEACAKATAHMKWVPNPGPQFDAYFCEADELFYGGQAGGGKSDLLLGLAINEHDRSLILRHTGKEARGLADRLMSIVGEGSDIRGAYGEWYVNGRFIETGGCEIEEDKQKYKGRPHSLKGFDEISDFTETQYRFIIAWNRSSKAGQRCRVVATGNPPTKPEGLWVLKYWGPWLDPQHPNPARPGELRWYTTIGGKDTEVDGPGPHSIEGESKPVYARSRTYIPAKLEDNPDQNNKEYQATLDALPDEYRAAYRDGQFSVALRDDAFQCIPSAWVYAAQERWTSRPPANVPMCSMGVDVAQGGPDQTVMAPRYDGWYPQLAVIPGKNTPDGKTIAGLVVQRRYDNATVVVDLGGGWGGDALKHLALNNIDAVGYMGVKKSIARTENKKHAFTNVRSEAYWRFREALDPSQEQGSTIALPRDSILVADLCAPKYKITSNGIMITPKDEVKELLGRSPDRGDAVVMAWWAGVKQANKKDGWAPKGQRPSVAEMSSKAKSRSRSRR